MPRAHIDSLEQRRLLSVSVFTVNNTNDMGAGSLRQAILDANAHPNSSLGPDKIVFAIPGAGPHVIQPATPLPGITDAANINGATQPDCHGAPTVDVDGTLAGSTDGLFIVSTAAGSTIRGLSVTHFTFNGIRVDGGNSTIAGNYLGLDPSGAAAPNGFSGLLINNSGNNVIGGTSAADRNVISGNVGSQLQIQGSSASGNKVLGNYIGTDPTGTAARPNNPGFAGVFVFDAPNNTFGGTQYGARNLISGNAGVGLFIDGSSSGSTASGNKVVGNYIGTDVSGKVALPNAFSGLALVEASGSLVQQNLISGNLEHGIVSTGSESVGNTIQGNLVGTDVTGTKPLGNAVNGIILADGTNDSPSAPGTPSHTLIGGTGRNGGNVVSANGGGGIVINGVGGDNNTVQGNFVGTDVTGTKSLGNASTGVTVFNGAHNLIGGTQYGAGNVVSANGESGVVVTGGSAVGNTIQGNLIGTDVTGRKALGNAFNGVNLNDGLIGLPGATQTLIGGTTSQARNIISGNLRSGVRISSPGVDNNSVQGNYIGLDITGTKAIGNVQAGVLIGIGTNNVVGGTSAGARNVISGNQLAGVEFVGSGSVGNTLAGNYIGTSADGNHAVPNQGDGVVVGDGSSFSPAIPGVPQSLTIGGSTANAGNVISGNTGAGININAATSGTVTILNNDIGTQACGNFALGNGGDGVLLQNGAAGVIIGQPGSGNTIAFNRGSGVALAPNAGIGNSIRGNSIFSNAKLGIDLNNDGVTPNDFQDPDTGPNNLQNFPVLTSAKVKNGQLAVAGTLNSRPSTNYTIDFYLNSVPDPSGYGEGEVPVGSITVMTDSNGNATFTASLSLAGARCSLGFLSATATGPVDGTSEFAKDIKVS